MKRYEKASLPEIPAVECPCGMTRRAFVDAPNAPASIHMVDIKKDSEVHYHKEHSELYEMILAMDDKYKMPLLLYYYEGYSVKEIAEILEEKENTIKSNLSRGRKKLKVDLEKKV